MKKSMFFLALTVLIGFSSCKNKTTTTSQAQQNKTEATTATSSQSTHKFPEITFEESTYDFGTITQGETVTHVYTFTNTGTASLKILGAHPSCGCTVPEWSKEPIAPGEQGSITVKFNSTGRQGIQRKSVRLTTNTKNGNELIRFTAKVTQ